MYQSIDQIKAANAAAGLYFFSPDTMRFFRSRVASSIVYGGRYFITSEQFHALYAADGPRLYTIRRCNDDGSIETIGEFQGYETLKAAKDVAKKLGKLFASQVTSIRWRLINLHDGGMAELHTDEIPGPSHPIYISLDELEQRFFPA